MKERGVRLLDCDWTLDCVGRVVQRAGCRFVFCHAFRVGFSVRLWKAVRIVAGVVCSVLCSDVLRNALFRVSPRL